MKLTDCNDLSESDLYFEKILDSSSKVKLLGDIELNDEEINHLGKLISKELRNHHQIKMDSISIAVYLVWIGIKNYRENFWEPVYKNMNLPLRKSKWQKILGDIFLKVIEKYNLKRFEGKSKYIIPILAHGYVPDNFLNDYFNNVVLPLYLDRRKVGIENNVINKEEVFHIINIWNKELESYQNLEEDISELEEKEKYIRINIEIYENREELLRLKELYNKLIDNDEINEILSLPDNWLENIENKYNDLKKLYSSMESNIEQILEVKVNLLSDLNDLNNKIKNLAEEILSHWDEKFEETIINIPIENIEKIIKEYNSIKKIFNGVLGNILKIFLKNRYKRIIEYRLLINEYLYNLPVKEDCFHKQCFTFIKSLKTMKNLIEQKKKCLNDLRNVEKELAAYGSETVIKEDLNQYKKQLSELKKEIARYKMSIIKLGKGDYESGVNVIEEQKNIRLEIEELKEKIKSSFDIDELLDNLNVLDYKTDINELKNELRKVQMQKELKKDRRENVTKPIYALNESTRVFLIQGEEISCNFVWNSIMLLQKLFNGDSNYEDIELPNRLINSMIFWWRNYNIKKLIDENDKRFRDINGVIGVTIKKPIVRLDTYKNNIEIEFPPQLIDEYSKCRLLIEGSSGNRQEKEIYYG